MSEIVILGGRQCGKTESVRRMLEEAKSAGHSVRIATIEESDRLIAAALSLREEDLTVRPPDPQVLEQVARKAQAPINEGPPLKRRGKHRGRNGGAFGSR